MYPNVNSYGAQRSAEANYRDGLTGHNSSDQGAANAFSPMSRAANSNPISYGSSAYESGPSTTPTQPRTTAWASPAPAPRSASRPAYSQLAMRLRSGPPVSPLTLGPCQTNVLFTHNQVAGAPLNYDRRLAAYGMSQDHYRELVGWLVKETKHKFRVKWLNMLLFAPIALPTMGMLYVPMLGSRENYANKEIEKLCNAVSREYEPHGINVRFRPLPYSDDMVYTFDCIGHDWRALTEQAG